MNIVLLSALKRPAMATFRRLLDRLAGDLAIERSNWQNKSLQLLKRSPASYSIRINGFS